MADNFFSVQHTSLCSHPYYHKRWKCGEEGLWVPLMGRFEEFVLKTMETTTVYFSEAIIILNAFSDEISARVDK